MNPLQQGQVRQLNSIGCSDLARKVNELVNEFNILKKKLKEEDDIDYVDNLMSDDAIVDDLFKADTKQEVRRILNDYLEV